MHALGSIDQIPLGEGRTFRVGGIVVAVFRTRDGHLRATQATCPHRGGPLAEGLVGGGVVVCPLHGRRFDLATGEGLDGCDRLRTFTVVVRDGEMFVENAELTAATGS